MTASSAATTTTTIASGTVTLGGKIHDTVKVKGNAKGGAPTGTVTIHVCGPLSTVGNCNSSTTGYTPVATATPTTGTKTTTNFLTTYKSVTFTPTTAGLWCFSSVYAPSMTTDKYIGSSDNTGSTGKTNKTGQVSTPECVTVTKTTTKTTTTISASVALGPTGKIHDTATVTGIHGSAPTGTVAFHVCGALGRQRLLHQLDHRVHPRGHRRTHHGYQDNTGRHDQVPVSHIRPHQRGDLLLHRRLHPGDEHKELHLLVGQFGHHRQDGTVHVSECVAVTPATSVTTTTVNLPTTSHVGSKWSDKATVTGNSVGGAPTGSVTYYVCKVSTALGQTGTCAAVTGNKVPATTTPPVDEPGHPHHRHDKQEPRHIPHLQPGLCG